MEEMRIDKKYGYLIINGKYYEGTTKDGKPVFKEVKIDEIKDKITKAEKIADKLKTKVDVKKMLKEAVMRIPLDDIDKLYVMLFVDKKKKKVKTREHHCVDVKIGNFILPIVD